MSKTLVTIDVQPEKNGREKFIFKYNGIPVQSKSGLYKYRNSAISEWENKIFDIIKEELFYDEYIILVLNSSSVFSTLQTISASYHDFSVYAENQNIDDLNDNSSSFPKTLREEFAQFLNSDHAIFPDEENIDDSNNQDADAINVLADAVHDKIPTLSDVYFNEVNNLRELANAEKCCQYLLLDDLKAQSREKMNNDLEIKSAHLVVVQKKINTGCARFLVRLFYLGDFNNVIEPRESSIAVFAIDPILFERMQNSNADSLCVQFQL